MPYAILQSRSGTASNRQWEPTDLIFDTGGEAGDWVKSENVYAMNCGNNNRFKAIRISEDDPMAWRQRELRKLNDGTYTRLPWADEYRNYGEELYAHVDPEDGTKVRFIACPTDGMQGIYTRMNPGRFMRKFIDSEPNPRQMDAWCAQMGLDLTTSPLMIATTAEEIVRVYNEGPHSCMAYKLDDCRGPFTRLLTHPVATYGDSDIALAYIERRGEITARCLIWQDKKIHGRIYGDRNRLLERLRENNYIEDWYGFVGAKIRQIYSEKKLIVPYIDGDCNGVVKDGKEWLILSDQPTIIGKSPNGIALTESCQECGRENVPLVAYRGEDDDYDEPSYNCAEGCNT